VGGFRVGSEEGDEGFFELVGVEGFAGECGEVLMGELLVKLNAFDQRYGIWKAYMWNKSFPFLLTE